MVFPKKSKAEMGTNERFSFELELKTEFDGVKKDTERDLTARVGGVATKRGASGFQFSGYNTLEQFYRGDQWSQNEPPGASQKTDNYCAVIVDNRSEEHTSELQSH